MSTHTYVVFLRSEATSQAVDWFAQLRGQHTQATVALFVELNAVAEAESIDTLWALKNQAPAHTALHFLAHEAEDDATVLDGKLTADKCLELLTTFFSHEDKPAINVTLLGFAEQTQSTEAALSKAGYPVTTAVDGLGDKPATTGDTAGQEQTADRLDAVQVSVIMDGTKLEFSMDVDEFILDAAEAQGLDLPFSCRGGVCSTCRTFVVEGNVDMATNFALDDDEVEQGFILACQALPLSARIVLDYDKT